MQKIVLTFFYFFLFLQFSTVFAQSDQEKHSIYFASAEYSLDENSELTLKELSQQLTEYADYSIDIQAHTDDQGDTEYNKLLANKRANAVQNFLLAQDITVDNLTASAFGEDNPKFDNKEETGRRLNRRVDIYVKTLDSADFTEIQKQWQKYLEQSFSIDGQKRTQVFGKDGTKLWLEANTFIYKNGEIPTGEIDLRLTECYSFGNMLLADLTTMSGDKLLQTGGMMKIEAFANGEELVIAEGKSVQVAAPTKAFDKDMQLFYGKEHPENDRLEDWQLADNRISASIQNDFSATRDRNSPYMGPKRPGQPTAIIYTIDSTFMPKKPIKPETKRFRPVAFPDTISVYTQKRKGSIFTSKSKLEEERTAKINKIMTRYEKRLARLEYNKEAYAKSLIKFEKNVLAYPKKLAEWDKEVKVKEARFYSSENYKSLTLARGKWYEKDLARYKKARAEHKEMRKKRAEDFERELERKGGITADAMNYYFFQINQSGWINCDKFSGNPDRELLVVNENSKTKESAVYAVFTASNSIIRLNRNELGEINKQSFPRGEKVMIVGWQVKDGQPMMAKTETVIGNKNSVNLNYRKVRLQELRETLAGI
ncbi:MAG: hypothetical protein ACI85O_003669 [Saprospiraceae bacterium]|jgi:hypothetical protein